MILLRGARRWVGGRLRRRPVGECLQRKRFRSNSSRGARQYSARNANSGSDRPSSATDTERLTSTALSRHARQLQSSSLHLLKPALYTHPHLLPFHRPPHLPIPPQVPTNRPHRRRQPRRLDRPPAPDPRPHVHRVGLLARARRALDCEPVGPVGRAGRPPVLHCVQEGGKAEGQRR